ncbi:MAG: kelch repeat-containing protein [Terriglobales bacterium]
MQPRLALRNSSTRITTALAVLAVSLCLVHCGSNSGSRVQAPALSYSALNATYTRGTQIPDNTPVNTGGTPTSYAVSPALPAGITLNTTTGVISGTPSAVTAQTAYSVTASNAGGNASISLSITVNDIAPSGLTYSTNPATYADLAAIAPNAPSWSGAGGTPTSFAVSPSLPAGLSLNSATGTISGTPTNGVFPQANYTITASNTGGSTTATLSITVIPQAPFIAVQPLSQYVASGASTTLSVQMSGMAINFLTLNYQWYQNGAAIGSNNTQYTTQPLTPTNSGEQFYVVITDNYNRSVTSSTATLTVKGTAGTFVSTGTTTIARSAPTATLLPNGQVLVVGGRSGNNVLQTAELYDPSTGSFTETGSLNTARVDHSATLLQNGQVLIAGGYSVYPGLPTIASAELYDPSTGNFTPTGSLGVSRTGHSATLLANGKVLIASGSHTSDGYTWANIASAELYDPVAGTFSATGSLNHAGEGGGVLLGNGQVLFAGGYNANEGTLSFADLYDPTTAAFTATGSLITARMDNSATLLQNGQVLIAGGTSSNGSAGLATAELYDPSAGTFTATGSIIDLAVPVPTGTLLNSGQVLIDLGTYANSEIYDPTSGAFITNSLPDPNDECGVDILLKNGKVLLLGQGTSAVTLTPPIPAQLYEP